MSKAVHYAWIKSDFTPTPVCSNCSGKHAGMIAGTKALGADVQSYHLSEHPMQIRVRRTVDEICGLGEGDSTWGLDGCNLPAPAFPLHCLARMYAAFAQAASDNTMVSDPRIGEMKRIFNAMGMNPYFVAGEDRFCTVLMRAYEGLVIGKLGADGCYGVGVRACDSTRRLGVDGGIGIAVKIEDGNIDILYSAVAEILEQLQIGSPEMRRSISAFHRPEIKNTVGIVTGRVSPAFSVRAVPREDVS